MTNPYLSLDQKIVGDIYTSPEAMDNLSVLCDDFGSRFGGTEGEKLAAEFIRSKLEEYGLSNVHLEPIEYLGWTRGEAQLEIISPIQKALSCITLPYSPPVEIEGEIIDLRDGAPADFELRAAEIKGKIVMTNSVFNPKNIKRWVHRKEKFGRSMLAGASGFIFVNHYPGYGPATGGIGHKGKAALIPGISINKEDGAYIQRLARRKGPVQIRLTTTDKLSPMTSWNVLGDLPGNRFPEEIIMLGSHYDGRRLGKQRICTVLFAISYIRNSDSIARTQCCHNLFECIYIFCGIAIYDGDDIASLKPGFFCWRTRNNTIYKNAVSVVYTQLPGNNFIDGNNRYPEKNRRRRRYLFICGCFNNCSSFDRFCEFADHLGSGEIKVKAHHI